MLQGQQQATRITKHAVGALDIFAKLCENFGVCHWGSFLQKDRMATTVIIAVMSPPTMPPEIAAAARPINAAERVFNVLNFSMR
jgi:hypothetical protein